MNASNARGPDTTAPGHAQDASIAAGALSRHGLHAIAIAECVKGLLALALACGLAIAGPQALRDWIVWLLQHVHVDPRHGVLAGLLKAIDPSTLHVAIAVVLAYGVLRLVEAWGLWRAQAWASWFGCLSAAVYLPFEIHALLRHPGWIGLVILLVNLLVVAILAHDLRRRRRNRVLSPG